MKKLSGVHQGSAPHWVGDGFPVRTLFSYDRFGKHVSPFLLLDHAGPAEFTPAEERRGVGEHPHRGFETVTIVYQGELEHSDSAGNHGQIGPGDVQWMTAASGVVHEEWHERAFTRRGGVMEMAQLWVNLPKKDKMSAPRYQEIRAASIPTIQLDGGNSVRVIAGAFQGMQGPARTFTPLNVWDVRLKPGRPVRLEIPEGFTTIVPVLEGTVKLNGAASADNGSIAVFERDGKDITLEASSEATVLVLSGVPIDEPVAGYGPFVMNTQDEIREAIRDYQNGRMGHIEAHA